MKALAAANTALAARDGVQAIRANPAQAGGVNLSLSIGASQSSSTSVQTTDRAAGSSVVAGGDIHIRATGAAGESVILIQGSHVRAEHNLRLEAEQQVQLLAARNTAEQSGSQSSKSGSVGITVGTGGLGYTASASGGGGSSEGSDLTYTNTHLGAGGQVLLRSGSDTTLQGAVVQGPRIIFDVGGQLTIQSLQDTSTYASRHGNTGGSLTVGATPNASFSLSRGRVDSEFASVIEQSGLVAGDGGFTVQVAGNTSLVGGVIASSDRAVQAGLNRLTTATLTVTDLQNSASASASASAIGLSSEVLTQGKYGETKAVLTNVLTTSKEAVETSGATRAAVSGAIVEITNDAAQRATTGQGAAQTVAALNRDAAGAHTAADRPAAEAVERAVQASLAIKQEAVTQVTMLTDEAYRSRFLTTPTLLKGTCPAGVNCEADPTKLTFRRATPEELAKAEAGTVLAVNGILNDEKRAVELAYQNLEPKVDAGKPRSFFLMHIAPAQNSISELLAVAYEKVVASSDYGLANFLGYTNGQEMYADLLRSRGNQATLSLGHSRGTLVQESAFTILNHRPDGAGSAFTNPSLSVRGVGGAAAADAYANKAVKVIGEENRDNITFSYFKNDPVSVLAGGNPGVTTLSDIWKLFTTNDSMHSCYGTGTEGCTQVEIPTPHGNAGTPEGNAKLIRFKGGVQVDAQGNPIATMPQEKKK
jgi:filamentous hemagglutinin